IGFRSKKAGDTAEVMLYKLALVKGDTIDFAALVAAKLVPSSAKRAKIVNKGELSRKLVLKGIATTAGARAAIEAAGGQVEEYRLWVVAPAQWVASAGWASSPSCGSACCSWSAP